MISACSGNEKKADAEKTEKKTVKVESESFEPTTNIRYYNMDSVMANYELVKTFNEANLRTMTELQNAQRSREGELNRLAASIQQKMQNNGYLSEASYNADVAELNKNSRPPRTTSVRSSSVLRRTPCASRRSLSTRSTISLQNITRPATTTPSFSTLLASSSTLRSTSPTT